MSTADRFLSVGSSSLSDGVGAIFVGTLSASNLDPSKPCRTDANRIIVNGNISIQEVTGLQTALNNTQKNPAEQDIDMNTIYTVKKSKAYQLVQQAGPVTLPAAGNVSIWAKTDDTLHMLTDDGADYEIPTAITQPSYIISPGLNTRVDATNANVVAKYGGDERLIIDGSRSKLTAPNPTSYLDTDSSNINGVINSINRFNINILNTFIYSPSRLSFISLADQSAGITVSSNSRLQVDVTGSYLRCPNTNNVLQMVDSSSQLIHSSIPRVVVDANSSTVYSSTGDGYLQIANDAIRMTTPTAAISGGCDLSMLDGQGINMSFYNSRVFDTGAAGTVITGGRLNSSSLSLLSNSSGIAGTTDFIRLSTNGNTERMRILSNGNVGINIAAPSVKLHVVGSSGATLRIQDGNEGNGKIMVSDANGVATWTTSPYALTSGKLNQFAATSSTELAGVISDETGSGSLVFANTPTLTTPNLGVATATSLATPAIDTASAVAMTIGANNATLISIGRAGQIVNLVSPNSTIGGYNITHGIFTSCTTTSTVANSTAETSIMGTLNGSAVLPSNSILTGQCYRLMWAGTLGYSTGTGLRFIVRGGVGGTTGNILADTGVFSGMLTGAGQPYFMEVKLFSTGSNTGKFAMTIGIGLSSYGLNYTYYGTNTLTQNVSNTISVTAVWGTADVGNTVSREVMCFSQMY